MMQPKISEFTKRCFKGLTYDNTFSGTFSPLTISRSMYRLNTIVQNDTFSKYQLSYFFGKNKYPFSKYSIKKYTERTKTFLISPNEPFVLSDTKPSITSTTSVILSSSEYPAVSQTYGSPSPVKVVTSAFDFKENWLQPMYKVGVSGFKSFNEKMSVNVNMMSSNVPIKCNYYEDDKITLIEKPLKNNIVMGFISAHYNYYDLGISNLDQYLQAMETKHIVVSIPEFNITNIYDTEFKKLINKKVQVFTHHNKDYIDFKYFFNCLGITEIFWPNIINLTGVYGNSVSVKQIRHETSLNINTSGINTINYDQKLTNNNRHIKVDKEFYTDQVFTWYVRNTIDNNIILCGIFDGIN